MPPPALPAGSGPAAGPLPRRERLRQATIEEIKETARRQLAVEGAAALSLRGVAREMGLTASALYRYFPSREELLTALVVDAFTSLAEQLERTRDASAGSSGGQLWVNVATAYRRWALSHPSDYTLVFGTPVPGFEAPADRVVPAMQRGIGVLMEVMAACVAGGEMDLERLDAAVTPGLRPQLEAWRAEVGDLPPGALSAAMTCWATLHGLITLELFHHLPPVLLGDALFDQQMVVLLDRVGYIGPRPVPGGTLA